MLFKEIHKSYKNKSENNAKNIYPLIKNIFEKQNNQFQRIVVPFTDGNKTLNIVTDLEKAYETNGKQLINDFEKNSTLLILDNAWKIHLKKNGRIKRICSTSSP